jgi:Ser/Thr protein kinase RdoA (MazF antagonist)
VVSQLISTPTQFDAALRGFREVSPVERAGFGMLTSFAITIGVSRAINYARERRRAAPRLRSWARHAYHSPGQEQLRVHHFMPGIGLAFLSGAGAILKRNDGREFWFSLPFGIGAGLTLDEIAILTELDNPYWESEKLAAAQAAIAAGGALALAVRFQRHGKHPADGTPDAASTEALDESSGVSRDKN